jgi:hypothetical protein
MESIRRGGRSVRVALAAVVLLAVALWTRPVYAGYTHYWKWRTPPAPAPLEASLAEMEKLALARRDILTDQDGQHGSKPRFRGACPWGRDAGDLPCIAFNGKGPDAHETFGFPLAPFTNDPNFSFVKTAYKPYDVVAVACLIVARDHFPAAVLEISSDGTWTEDFGAGARLYEEVLGRPAHDPLEARVQLPRRADADVKDAATAPVSPESARSRWLVFGLLAVAFVAVLVVFRSRR